MIIAIAIIGGVCLILAAGDKVGEFADRRIPAVRNLIDGCYIAGGEEIQ